MSSGYIRFKSQDTKIFANFVQEMKTELSKNIDQLSAQYSYSFLDDRPYQYSKKYKWETQETPEHILN